MEKEPKHLKTSERKRRCNLVPQCKKKQRIAHGICYYRINIIISYDINLFLTNLECNVDATEEERKDILEKNGLLTDRHMFGGHKLRKEAFPDLDGFQDTIFSQQIENVNYVTGSGMF